MNTANIYDAISGFDEKYVAAADDAEAMRRSFRKKRARNVKIVGTVCACAALILAAGWLGAQGRFGKTPAVTPDNTTVADRHTTEPNGNASGENAAMYSQNAENGVTPPTDSTASAKEPSAVNGVMIPTVPSGENEDPSADAAHGPFQREGDPPIQYRNLVETYGDMQPVKYPWIGPGDHIISKALGDAINAYGNDNVTYRLRLTAYYEPLSKMTPDEQRAFYLAEADRFAAADENLPDKAVFVVESFKDDNTGEETVTFSAQVYDPAFLDSFPDHPDFGYLIELFGEKSSVK